VSTSTTSRSAPESTGSAEAAPRRSLRRFLPSGSHKPRQSRKSQQSAATSIGGAPRRWPWILALALVGVLLVGAVYAVFFSPLLGVRSVAITGAPEPLTAKVRAIVDVPDGTPLARVDLDEVAAKVEGVQEIADVEVARGWPDTLSIIVTPRVPVAVTSANGQFWLLDATGDPYLAVATPPAGLITVALVAPGVGDSSTIAALAVAAALTPDFRTQVASVSARTDFDVELAMVDGRKIIWGEATDSDKKMQILPALLLAREGTEYDITDPTLVTVR
jgi:cell division protein FtsQ